MNTVQLICMTKGVQAETDLEALDDIKAGYVCTSLLAWAWQCVRRLQICGLT